jgi:hypothetical protein
MTLRTRRDGMMLRHGVYLHRWIEFSFVVANLPRMTPQGFHGAPEKKQKQKKCPLSIRVLIRCHQVALREIRVMLCGVVQSLGNRGVVIYLSSTE